MFASALALGAALASGGFATAAEPTPAGTSGFTMTLGGKGTAAEAATSPEDTEETWCRRRAYCRGYYHGYNRGFYGGYGGYGGYSSFSYYSYRPAYYASYYQPYCYRPYYNGYSNGYYGGYGYGSYYGYGGGYGRGFYIGISGKEEDASAPAVSLNLAVAKNPVAAAPPRATEQPAAPSAAGGTFRYDGGPANPVPLPKPDATPKTAVPSSPGLPVSLKKETSSSPYRYKAYGEK
jgi:hypothetical protein